MVLGRELFVAAAREARGFDSHASGAEYVREMLQIRGPWDQDNAIHAVRQSHGVDRDRDVRRCLVTERDRFETAVVEVWCEAFVGIAVVRECADRAARARQVPAHVAEGDFALLALRLALHFGGVEEDRDALAQRQRR